MNRRLLAGLWTLVVLALSVGGFLLGFRKSEPGDRCSGEEWACADAQRVLKCIEGHFVEFPCRGAQGCAIEGSMVRCDVSGNQVGDPCQKVVTFSKGDELHAKPSDEGHGQCSPDGKTFVVCRDGAIQHEPCRGPDGCHERGQQVYCDATVAAVGDPCKGEEGACSVDGAVLLKCKDGKLAELSSCRGPKGCALKGDRFACDDSLGKLGDPCVDGSSTCSLDRKSMLACADGKLARYHICRDSDCDQSKESACDLGYALPDDPCQPEGVGACTPDHDKVLRCEGGRFVLLRAVRECIVKGDSIETR